jgi:DNA-binding HxlR family transcriptional regulator
MLGTTAAPQAALRLDRTTSRTETNEWWGPPALDVFTGAANLLSAIGDPVRLQILWWLGTSERNVTDLCSLVGKRQQAVSHHLTILKLRRLVALHRRGKSNYYSLTESGREAMSAAQPFIQQ